jgi:hypothetical protein
VYLQHLAAYDVEGGGGLNPRQKFNATFGARDMWETFMPAFRACTMEGGASHVMCSYNAINGVPTCAEHGLLTEVREKIILCDAFVCLCVCVGLFVCVQFRLVMMVFEFALTVASCLDIV